MCDVTKTKRREHVRLLYHTTELREEHEVPTQKPFDKVENTLEDGHHIPATIVVTCREEAVSRFEAET